MSPFMCRVSGFLDSGKVCKSRARDLNSVAFIYDLAVVGGRLGEPYFYIM